MHHSPGRALRWLVPLAALLLLAVGTACDPDWLIRLPPLTPVAAPATAKPGNLPPPGPPQHPAASLPGTPVPASVPGWVAALAPGTTIRSNLQNGVLWAPDGLSFATASPAGMVTIWDGVAGQVLRTYSAPAGQQPRLLSWSPDGSLLVVQLSSPGNQGTLALWDAGAPTGPGQTVATIPNSGGAFAAAWSPDGQVLAWIDGLQLARWDRRSGQPLPKPQPTWPAPLPGGDSYIHDLAWSPDGRWLSAIQSRVVSLFDGQSGQPAGQLAHSGVATTLAWSQDSRYLAVAVGDDHPFAYNAVVWDITTRQQVRTLSEGTDERKDIAQALAWLDAGQVLAVAWQGTGTIADHVTLYDPASGAVLRTLPAVADRLVASPDGRALAAVNGYDSILTAWWPAGAPPTPTPPAAPPCPPALAPAPGTATLPTDAHLLGLTTVAADNVWAVGTEGAQSLIAHWNGNAWRAVAHPSAPGVRETLAGLAALAPADIWAVGEYSEPDTGASVDTVKTLVEHWDGQRWQIVPSEDPPPQLQTEPHGAVQPGVPLSRLVAGAARASDDAWAVGNWGDALFDEGPFPLIEHWDGTGWRITPLAADLGWARLSAVVALSASDAWAVGAHDSYGTGSALILHWDGTAWREVPSLDRPNVWLQSVVAAAPGDVWAIGYQALAMGDSAAIALHWDGTAWHDESPLALGQPAYPHGAVLVTPGEVWTAGRTLLRRLAGGWSEAPVPGLQPNAPDDYNYHGLDALAAAQGTVWAAGDDAGGHPLVLRGTAGACGTPGP